MMHDSFRDASVSQRIRAICTVYYTHMRNFCCVVVLPGRYSACLRHGAAQFRGAQSAVSDAPRLTVSGVLPIIVMRAPVPHGRTPAGPASVRTRPRKIQITGAAGCPCSAFSAALLLSHTEPAALQGKDTAFGSVSAGGGRNGTGRGRHIPVIQHVFCVPKSNILRGGGS